jgi:aryl-alcohol dehydrogenase-like predicted oxidoreductase
MILEKNKLLNYIGKQCIQYKKIGNSNLIVSQIGIGAWSWGDRFFWGYGKNYGIDELRDAFALITRSGINFFDTAEMYAMGKSEKILGMLNQKNKYSSVIATKFYPFPWRVDPFSARRAVKNSLRRLKLKEVDLYQIHMPVPPYPMEYWLKKLADLQDQGYIKAIGVSNFNLEQTRAAQKYLEGRGLSLASNQVRYSIIDNKIEENGLYDYCLENNITIIAYSPLAMGMLTGKYTPKNPPKGVRRSAYRYTPEFLDKIQPLISLMREIGQGHGGKSPAQIAINWVICKGAIPIPGVKNSRQALENIKSVDFKLSVDEVMRLDNFEL